MDSGNSSSLQSSSGGGDDGEFDSRVDSLSAFFHTSTAASASAAALPPSHPPSLMSSSSAAVDAAHHFFDYSYLDSTPLLPLDSSPWPPRTLVPTPSSISCPAPEAGAAYTYAAGVQSSSSMQLPIEQPPAGAAATSVPRSSKKRSRASRRAPTTVLTTDASNFRAMVQEFTGIPSPPFAAAAAASASPFVRSRLDLFHSAAAFRSSSGVDAAPPSFLLRPFPQKVQSPPPFTSMFTNPTSSPPPPPLSPPNNAISGGLQSLLQPSLLGQNYTNATMVAALGLNAKAPPHILPHSAGYNESELGGRLLQPVLIGAEVRPTAGGDHTGGTSSQLRISGSCKPNYSVSGNPAEFSSPYGEGGGGGGGGGSGSGGEGRGTGGVMDSFFRLRDC